ncbi:MAG: DUF7504 family protein [Nitrososphaerales archaeon]
MTERTIPTKIPLLDDFLGGGLQIGALTAFWSEVGVEASALALQTLYNRAQELNDKILFVTTTKKPRQIHDAMEELGFTKEIDMEFIDAHPSQQGQTRNGLVLATKGLAFELQEAIKEKIERALDKHTLVVFDSFSALVDRLDSPNDAAEMLDNLKEIFQEKNSTGLFVFTQWAYEKSTLEKIRSTFDSIVELKSTSDKPVYSMAVSMPGSSSNRLAYFKVLRPGGVRIHIPKVVVTGPFHAGKTSFIHSASQGAVSADRLGTTVALDYAHVEHKGFLVDVFGTPGQSRFDPILQKLGSQALGVIVLVSATDSLGLNRVRSQMRLVKLEKIPFVVAVNKVNLRGALSLAAVRNLLGISNRVPLVPMRAKNLADVRPNEPCELDPRDVYNVLDKIVTQITKSESMGA